MSPFSFIVHSGQHARRFTPVHLPLPGEIRHGELRREDTGELVPAQIHDGQLHFIVDAMPEHVDRRYTFIPAPPGEPNESAVVPGVRLRLKQRAGTIDVKVGSRTITTYHFASQYPRPFFHPLLGPGKTHLTRNFPMIQDIADEPKDHKHHRSLWVGLGDVNRSDHWLESPEAGRHSHQQISQTLEGPVFGQFRQNLDWEDNQQRKIMEESRTFRAYMTPDAMRIIEFTIQFRASWNDVIIGDTKEAGVIAVRVAASMQGDRGGVIENSLGAIGEAETWGRPAHWCDYSGIVAGKHVGIAILDHPMNLRHPSTWHVRNYGLFTANPFGYGDFKSSHLTNGQYTIPQGEQLTFRYRMLLHKGDARKAKIAQRYHDYVNPPTIEPVT